MRASRLLALAAAIAVAGGACGGDGGGPSNRDPVADFDFACTQLVCNFTDASSDPDGADDITTSAWTFGEPGSATNTATTADAAHTYAAAGTYNVQLTVTDADGADNSVTQQVTVSPDPPANQPPVARFTVACSSLDCSFDAGTSTDADGTIASYSWAFSDGGTATGVTANHSFVASGLTDVSATLTVTDDDGAPDNATENFTVAPPAICDGGACDLTLPANASVTITLSNENCNAVGNTLRILLPVDVTLFTDGCHTAVGTTYDLGTPGQVFTAGTQIQPEVISGSEDLGFPPTLRIRAGTGYPVWVLEFDDGEACPAANPACGEPDFDDLEITITATP